MIGFDKLPGIVLLLDGRPVGEAWTSQHEPARTAAGIVSQCACGWPWWGSRPPVLLFNRAVTGTDTAALARCGLDLAVHYRPLAPSRETMGIQVYVPA
jgi:hypothetical protein